MSMPYAILVIDDEPTMRDSCYQILSRKGCEVWLSENGRQGLSRLSERPFDVVILDLKMPDINGFEILKRIQADHPETIVIVITGYPTVESAVEAMKLGARDFIPKPFTPNMLRTILSRTLHTRRSEAEHSRTGRELEVSAGADTIVGASPVMKELKRFIKKAARTDCSVLITGETGTGKELVARALHYHSRRRNNKFVTVDSGGLVDTLIESELFGHVKGSFTGAINNRTGRFEMAHKGTLFFDEIANMSLHIQSKLLRVLQEHEITPVGCHKLIAVDVRIIAATNTNLEQEIERNTFRRDLYYRLNVIPLRLPSLRERREDIPLLADYFLTHFRMNKEVKAPMRIAESAMEAMMNYTWPGNVRELEHLIKRAVLLSDEDEVDPFRVTGVFGTGASLVLSIHPQACQLHDVEREHIIEMLRRCGRNKSLTARMLGIDRKTLRNKMKKYDISESSSYPE
jgi:DNA-binding NtrC family response regulator